MQNWQPQNSTCRCSWTYLRKTTYVWQRKHSRRDGDQPFFHFCCKNVVIVFSQDQYFQIQQLTTVNICLCCFYWVDCFGIRRKQREKLLSTSAECMNFTTVNQWTLTYFVPRCTLWDLSSDSFIRNTRYCAFLWKCATQSTCRHGQPPNAWRPRVKIPVTRGWKFLNYRQSDQSHRQRQRFSCR